MFSLPQTGPQPDGAGNGPIIPFTESSETIDTLLRVVYPDEDPDLKLVHEIEGVVEAAIKYDMPKCISIMRKKLILCASKEPIRVFMIACKNKLADVASAAAHLSLRRPILYSFELGSVVLPFLPRWRISLPVPSSGSSSINDNAPRSPTRRCPT
jgi:hypothetical protein